MDTNVIIEVARNQPIGKRILADLDLLARPERPLASIVSLGEALALAEQWHWGEGKTSRLREIFGELVMVDLSFGKTAERYGRISAHCRDNSLGIGENDRWIAAGAAETGANLVTVDKDFDPLDPLFISRTLVPGEWPELVSIGV